jgi:hypothetical protein
VRVVRAAPKRFEHPTGRSQPVSRQTNRLNGVDTPSHLARPTDSRPLTFAF